MPKYSLRQDNSNGSTAQFTFRVTTIDGIVGGGAMDRHHVNHASHNNQAQSSSRLEREYGKASEQKQHGRGVVRHIVHVAVGLLVLSAIVYAVLNKTGWKDKLKRTFLANNSGRMIANHSQTTEDKAQTIIRSIETDVVRKELVQTKTGQLEGFVQNVNGTMVSTFLSVPYGMPPIDARRFRRTVPMQPWQGVKQATRMPPPCIQSEYTQRIFPVTIINDTITEDCLFLNIWAPSDNRDKQKRSVMIFLPGGMFTIGSIGLDEYDGRVLAAVGDVIVVTVQYRLGIFGFLDLDTEQVPGNMGLFDQYTAMEWVVDNVERFGGDAGSITLFGSSAGSISIGLHMFHPKASRLFQRAIMQSGSAMLLKQVYSRGEDVAEKFAQSIGCWSKANSSIYDNAEEIVACLDQTAFEVLYKAQDALVKDNPVPFMPTIPSDYIDNFINEYNETTELHQKQVIMGFNKNEGALIIHAAYPKLFTRHNVPQYTRLRDVQQKVIEMGVDSGLNNGQATSIANLLIKGKEVDTPLKWAQTIANLFGDVMFVCPIYDLATRLEQMNISTHLYMFDQKAKNAVWGEWMQVTHHDEINFIMGVPLRYASEYSQDDIRVSRIMMHTWAHFAKTGQILNDEFEQPWEAYNSSSKSYMHISAHNQSMGTHFHHDTCELYNLFSDYIS